MSVPLSSLKILDFSTLLPGPFASMMLADLGAEILRIESPIRPDLVRMLPPASLMQKVRAVKSKNREFLMRITEQTFYANTTTASATIVCACGVFV